MIQQYSNGSNWKQELNFEEINEYLTHPFLQNLPKTDWDIRKVPTKEVTVSENAKFVFGNKNLPLVANVKKKKKIKIKIKIKNKK